MNSRHNDGREEDLFLDNEDEPDDDQLSGSGDRPPKRTDVGQNDDRDVERSDYKNDFREDHTNEERSDDRTGDKRATRRSENAIGTLGRSAASQKVTATIR